MEVKKLLRKLFGILLLFFAGSPFLGAIREPQILDSVIEILGGLTLGIAVFFLLFIGLNYLFGD